MNINKVITININLLILPIYVIDNEIPRQNLLDMTFFFRNSRFLPNYIFVS